MRELVFAEIAGNPYIKKEDKPTSVKEIFRIKDDQEKRVKDKETARTHTSPEELEAIKETLLSAMNNGTVKQPPRKNKG